MPPLKYNERKSMLAATDFLKALGTLPNLDDDNFVLIEAQLINGYDRFRNVLREVIRDISDEHVSRMVELMAHIYSGIQGMVRAQKDFTATSAELNTLANIKHYGLRKNNVLSLCETDEKDVPVAFLNILDLQSVLFFSECENNHTIVNDLSGFTKSLFDVINNLHENVENVYAHVFSSLKRIYVPSGKDWHSNDMQYNRYNRSHKQLESRADRADRWKSSIPVIPALMV